MESLNWKQVCEAFYDDGSRRHLFIFDTTIDDWQRLLVALRNSKFTLKYYHGKLPTEIPTHVVDALIRSERAITTLSVTINNITTNCHFSSDEVIDFDIDPREIDREEPFRSLLDFMRFLATTVGKESVMTPENSPETVLLRCSPETEVVSYSPCGG